MATELSNLAKKHGVRMIAAALGLLSLVIFFKIAWVTDDAYISFRSVEQVFDGHGPRWNPGERVQVYTSPLWFWMLAAVRVVSSNVFMNAIVLSAVLFLAMLVALRRGIGADLPSLACLALLIASNGFFDYTSSGLENALGYVLIAMFLDAYRCATTPDALPRRRSNALRLMLVVFGLQLVCRHDLLTLTLIPTGYALWSCRAQLDRRTWLRSVLIALAPLAVWTIFSLIYYGAPLPNTAYAKLAAGIPRPTLLAWGWQYLADALRYDPITLVGLAAGAVALLVFAPARGRVIAGGILVNLGYVVWVGGDFMRGRFLAFAYLMAVAACSMFLLSAVGRRRVVTAAVAGAAVAYALAFAHTPVNSPRDHRVDVERPTGPIDERGYYWQASLTQYLRRGGDVFPDQQWAKAGHMWGQGAQPFVERGVIGYFGYWAGVDKTIVDHFGLADAFLARLPADPRATYRVGHYRRQVPQGYLDIFMSAGQGRILDADLNAYYDKMRIVTQGEPLLTAERLKTIVNLNLGRYDHYLQAVRTTASSNR